MKQGWEYKKLGEVCSKITDGSHNPPKGIEYSDYLMISSQNIYDDEIRIGSDNVRFLTEQDFAAENKRTALRPGMVLLTIVGTIGRACVVKGDEGNIVLQRSVAALSPTNDVLPRYLMLSLIGKRSELNAEARGIAQKGIYLKQLSTLEIPLPPLSEQQAIVAELDKINEIIDLKKAQLKDLDLLAQSIFYDMFGDPIENPKGWEVKKLGEIYLMKAGKAIKAKELSEKHEEGLVPCFGGNGIRGYIAKVSHTKSAPIIGRQGAYCGTVNFANAPFYATEHAVVVNSLIDVDEIWSYYCLSFLHLEKFARGQAQPGIAVGTLAEEAFTPLPPLSLQQSFAEKIQTIESQKSAIKQSLAETETLLASRMDYYFS